MQRIVVCIASDGLRHLVRPEDAVRLSPFGHEYTNLLGRYSFSVPDSVARGELRPLTKVDHEETI